MDSMLTKDQILERLFDDEQYYGEFGKRFLSASDLKRYLTSYCPKQKPMNYEALEFGRLFHTMVLEPNKYALERPQISQDTLRDLEELKVALNASQEATEVLEQASNKFEVPYIKEINGIWLKCKVDIDAENELWDLKTTSNLDAFRWSSKVFGYHISAFQYYLLTGKVMHFILVEKGTGRVKLYKSDEEFYKQGRRDWMWAMRNYKISLTKEWVYMGTSPYYDKHFEMIDNVPFWTKGNKLYTFINKL